MNILLWVLQATAALVYGLIAPAVLHRRSQLTIVAAALVAIE